MGAPSPLHEARVALLGEMADLAGFVIPSRIDGHLTPDLVRLHHRYPRLFVADAKATESPDNHDTRTRILFYLRAIRPWIKAGFKVQAAICADVDPVGRWLETLRSATQFSGLMSSAARTYLIDDETQIASVTVQFARIGISATRPCGR